MKVAGTAVSNDNSGREGRSDAPSFRLSFFNASACSSIVSRLAYPYNSSGDLVGTGTGLRIGGTSCMSSFLITFACPSIASGLAYPCGSSEDVAVIAAGLRIGLRAIRNRLRSSSRGNGLDSSALYGGGGSCSA